MNIGETVGDRVRAEIEASGPMPFDRYMEVTLYGPGGYFASERLRSHRSGDFLTSPEVSPAFGETLARAAAGERERIGSPFTLVEIGAGSGSLLEPMLAALDPPPDHVFAVEVSPAARRSLAERVPGAQIVDSLADVPSGIRAVVVANELLDNLPAALVIRRAGEWRERAVAVAAAGLEWVEIAARPQVAAWASSHAPAVEEGAQVEVQLAAGAWMTRALSKVAAGAVVVVDYGDTSEGLANRRAEGTMRTYRDHHLGPDPLFDPGSTDITMDVDFTALASVAIEHGASTELWRQDEYLAHWGLLDRIAALREHELEAARSGDTMSRLRWRNLVTGAETLLHPRGLGDFRVLVARM